MTRFYGNVQNTLKIVGAKSAPQLANLNKNNLLEIIRYISDVIKTSKSTLNLSLISDRIFFIVLLHSLS